MVRDVLAIQASSIASEAAFSTTMFQIGDHRHSLAEDSLETTILFRDWSNAERRNNNLPKLSKKQASWIKTQIECSDDELEAQEFLTSLPTPEDITIDMMRQLELNFKRRKQIFLDYIRELIETKPFLEGGCVKLVTHLISVTNINFTYENLLKQNPS